MGFREIKLGFKDLDQDHMTQGHVRRKLKNLYYLGILSAQKEGKEREISMDLEAYMCSRLMKMVLEYFLHLI